MSGLHAGLRTPVVAALLLALGLASLVAASPAVAQGAAPATVGVAPDGFDSIVARARDSAANWSDRMGPYAWSVFGALAVIDLVVSLGRSFVVGSELGTTLEVIVSFVLRKGFWAFVLGTHATLMSAIVFSFQKLGLIAATSFGNGITPQRLINGINELATQATSELTGFNLLRDVEVMFSIAIVFASYWLCAALIWLAWIRAYVVLAVSKILMAFGGSRWTEDLAVRALQYPVAAGVHLLVLTLLQGLFFDYLDLWIGWAKLEFTLQQAMSMAGCAVVVVISLVSIPHYCTGIVTGSISHLADAAALAAATKLIASATSSVAGAVGGLATKIDNGVSTLLNSFSGAGKSGGDGGGGGVSVAVGAGGGGGGGAWSGPQLSAGGGAPPLPGGGAAGGGRGGGPTGGGQPGSSAPPPALPSAHEWTGEILPPEGPDA